MLHYEFWFGFIFGSLWVLFIFVVSDLYNDFTDRKD